MSLGKLLNAGRSLVGLHNSGERYQLRTGALPKFGSRKNPFAAQGESSSEAAEQLTPAEMAAASLKDTQRLPLLIPKPAAGGEGVQPVQPENPVVASPSPAPKGGTANVPAQAPTAVSGWLKKLNPLVWWENRKPAEPKSAIPRFNKAPVQAELSLDNIKVMRNDLSDADVEVVPMKARPAKMPPLSISAMPTAAAAMAIPELPPATNAWEFLGERLLGKH
jgi:hypothetical protein